MSVAVQRVGVWRVVVRGTAIAALAFGTAACASIQNMMPDPASFRLPDRSTFLPSPTTAFAAPVSAGPVGPADLVDAQGQCPGAAPASSDAATPTARSVALEMTECQVVRTLGLPQNVQATPGVHRTMVLTYVGSERAGIYQFIDGRLTSIERGEEPEPPPPVAKKPPAKKPKPPPPA
jgi:hypothetical protein